MPKKIALVRGDGIGPEIVGSALKILDSVSARFGRDFECVDAPMGGAAIDAFGTPMPQSSVDACKTSDAVLLGAVGGPKWDHLSGDMRPESALLGIRKAMKAYANIRPAKLYPALRPRSPIGSAAPGKGFDLVIVRELTGGIYFGARGYRIGRYGREAYDTEAYSQFEIERIVRVAFDLAMKRSKRVASVDKANVLESSRLWRYAFHEIALDYPEVSTEDMLVDNAAMQLVRDPSAFDVIVTTNMFGDILSDLAGALTGGIGLLPSASFGDGPVGIYEPVHGSAPTLPPDAANPIGTILSLAMLLEDSLDMPAEARCVRAAVEKTLNDGYRTRDICLPNDILCSTSEITAKIQENMRNAQ